MTLTLRPLPPRIKSKADTRALKAAHIETHTRLGHEIAEQKMSREMVDRHNRHLRDSQTYRQTGGN